jgi:hypothetical protein
MGGAAGAGTSALAAALALLVLSAGVAYTSGGRDPGAVLAWSVRSDPSRWDDVAYAVCEYGDYIYVVGAQDTNHGGYLRVEARSKFDGSLVGAWSADNLTFYAYSADCAIAGGLLYVAYGGWSVAVFDLQLNLLNRVVEPEYVPGGVTSVAVGGGYLYLAGYEFVEGGYSRWRVERWSVDGASLVRVKVYVSDPTPLSDEAMQVAVNPVTGHLWVVGHEADYRFRVEILDQDLNLVRAVSNRSRWLAYAVDFDENGYAYISGGGFIAKYDPYGNEVAVREFSYYWWAPKLLYVGGRVYAGANALCGNASTSALYIFDRDLEQLGRLCLGGAFERWGRAASDARRVYLAGWESMGWAILSVVVNTSGAVVVWSTATVTAVRTEVARVGLTAAVVLVVGVALGVLIGRALS